jgi:hypothetical protein
MGLFYDIFLYFWNFRYLPLKVPVEAHQNPTRAPTDKERLGAAEMPFTMSNR